MASVKAIESRLRNVMEQCAKQIARGESALELQQNAAERVLGDVENACEKFKSQTIEAVQAQTTSSMEDHRRAIQAAAQQMEQFETRDRARQADAEAIEKRLHSVMEQASTQISGGESALRVHREAVDRITNDVAHSCEKARKDAIAALQSGIDARSASAIELHQQEAERISNDVAGICAQAKTDTIDALQSEIDARLSDHGSAVQSAAQQMEELEGRLASLRGGLDQAVASHSERVQEEMRKGRESIDRALAEGKKAQLSLTGSLENEIQQTAEVFEVQKLEFRTQVQGEIDTLVSTVVDTQVEKLATLRDEVASLYEQLTASQNRFRDSHAMSDELSATAERLHGRVAELQEALAASGADIDDQFDRVNLTKTDLIDSLHRGEHLIRETDAATGQIETLMRNVHATLVDIGSASQRVEQAQAQLKDAEQVNARLGVLTQESARLEGTLAEKTAKASGVSDEMTCLSTDAESKVVQLSSHHAAASRVLRELVDTNKESHELIARTNQVEAQLSTHLEEVRHEAEAIGAQLTTLTEGSLATAKDLKIAAACATELMEGLSHITETADETQKDLVPLVADAKDAVSLLQDACDRSGTIAAETAELQRTLEVAGAVQTELDRVVDQSRALHEELLTASERAGRERLHLMDANQTTAGFVHELREVTGDAHESLDRLHEAVDQASSTTEASEHLLVQFTKRSEALQSDIVAFERRAAQIEENLLRLTEKPSAIVADAQVQAAHLEHVIQIVGKVFARLSKAGIEANDRANGLEETGKTASQRLAALCTENERASQALKQWTEEAIRVQQRLAQTITASPTIQQTHAPDSLQRMAELSRSHPRFVNASAADHAVVRHETTDTSAMQHDRSAVEVANERTGPSATNATAVEGASPAPRVLRSAQASRDVAMSSGEQGSHDMTAQQEVAAMIADAKAVATKQKTGN